MSKIYKFLQITQILMNCLFTNEIIFVTLLATNNKSWQRRSNVEVGLCIEVLLLIKIFLALESDIGFLCAVNTC